jgi:hypothetical protein
MPHSLILPPQHNTHLDFSNTHQPQTLNLPVTQSQVISSSVPSQQQTQIHPTKKKPKKFSKEGWARRYEPTQRYDINISLIVMLFCSK